MPIEINLEKRNSIAMEDLTNDTVSAGVWGFFRQVVTSLSHHQNVLYLLVISEDVVDCESLGFLPFSEI